MFNEIVHTFEIEGRKCSFATGKLARKSQVALLAKMDDTVILVTVNVGKAQDDADFFPMTVEYMEKMYAAGKMSGSKFKKRDGMPSDEAILKARMIDRSIRSRFPANYRNEVQIIVKVLSFDENSNPMILAINAVAAALMVSGAPITSPISGVCVGLDDTDNLVAQYNHIEREAVLDGLKMNLVIAGDNNGLTNIDSNFREVSEEKILEAFEYGLKLMEPWMAAQKAFAEMVGVKSDEYTPFDIPVELYEKMDAKFGSEIFTVITSETRRHDTETLVEKMNLEFAAEYSKRAVAECFEKVAKKYMRKMILDEDKRADGRKLDEIRPVACEVGLLPRAHGSALFTRGITQVLTVATLGTIRDQLVVDDMTGDEERRYLHFYEEAPFVFGETGKLKFFPGRREIGHGALAEKALYPVLPSAEEFPYTIMLVSEIMSEGGSSSQGSATASSMALMDAGVPIKKPVAGIAVGVMFNEDESQFKTIADIVDIEDFWGYMDFKVAGTRDGVTAIQMDTKSSGIKIEVFKDAFGKAKKGRLEIIEKMVEAIPTAKAEVSPFAPKHDSVKIPVDEIGLLIGPGGKNIKKISEESGAEFDIADDGTVTIYAPNAEVMEKAISLVKGSVGGEMPEIGSIHEGKVVGIKEFGAFVEIDQGISGLVHVSQISDEFIKDINTVVKMGDWVKVKVLDIDPQGKIKLTMKGL